MLSNSEIQRYSRQIIIPEIGPTGQSNIKNTSILVIGCGGIGSPCIMYLAAAGTVNLGIIDHDTLDISNLHRQVIHNHNHIGKSKTESASSFIKNLNPNVSCKAYNLLLTADNILDIIKDYDIILDATDNVASRYLINDACVLSKKPLISGSALKLNAQLTTYNYKSGPCYRCINPIPPPPSTIQNCGDAGILGAVVGVVGSMMAIEALKIAMGYDGIIYII